MAPRKPLHLAEDIPDRVCMLSAASSASSAGCAGSSAANMPAAAHEASDMARPRSITRTRNPLPRQFKRYGKADNAPARNDDIRSLHSSIVG